MPSTLPVCLPCPTLPGAADITPTLARSGAARGRTLRPADTVGEATWTGNGGDDDDTAPRSLNGEVEEEEVELDDEAAGTLSVGSVVDAWWLAVSARRISVMLPAAAVGVSTRPVGHTL